MRRFIFVSIFLAAACFYATAFAQPVKVLFFEAALAPADTSFSAEPSGYNKLAQLLRSEGMLVASMSTGEITREKLRPYQIVVVHSSPERPFRSGEVSALVWFIAQEGGTVFINGGTPQVINPLSEIFGISMDSSNLVDPSSPMEKNQNGHQFTLTNFPANAGYQAEGVKSVGFYGGSPLIISEDAAAVATGDEDCYSEDGFYSIGSFPPVAAVVFLGPGVMLVKSDRAMLDNQNIDQYQNKDWAKFIFKQLAVAHESSIDRNKSILGLRSRIHEQDKSLLDANEKVAKYEGDLTIGYQKMKELESKLQAAEKKGEDLGVQLKAMQGERDTLSKKLSRYQSSDVRKTVAVVAGAILIVIFFLGFSLGRWSLRSKSVV